MLCKRPTRKIEESVKEMQGKKFIIEEKLDGERMQLHKRGNEYFYCSRFVAWVLDLLSVAGANRWHRKGKDYTYLYGKHVGTGSLTPYVDAAFDERVEELSWKITFFWHSTWSLADRIILDGEMLVWDPISEKNLPFGTLKTAALG
jgi:DNA ligase-4